MRDLFKKNVSLAPFTTLGIGGNAEFFCEVKTVSQMQEVLSFCIKEKIAYFILGKGSNSLFDSRGIQGLVILNKIDTVESHGNGLFSAGAGCSFAYLGVLTARQNFSGLEFASGIPASLGGAIFMNAGAQGMETAPVIDWVEFIDDKGILRRFQKNELKFDYRQSPFQDMKGAIVRAGIRLIPDEGARLRQLQFVQARIQTQPYHEKSAGCIFQNPKGCFAGKLIDECGLKGYAIGGAQVSTMHANFLINSHNATSGDMLNLIQDVQKIVYEKKQVILKSEVRIIPYIQVAANV